MTLATLFPVSSLAEAKRQAAALGLTIRKDDLGGLETFPKGDSSAARYAEGPAEALALAHAWAEARGPYGFPMFGPTDSDLARAMIKAALAAKGLAPELAAVSAEVTAPAQGGRLSGLGKGRRLIMSAGVPQAAPLVSRELSDNDRESMAEAAQEMAEELAQAAALAFLAAGAVELAQADGRPLPGPAAFKTEQAEAERAATWAAGATVLATYGRAVALWTLAAELFRRAVVTKAGQGFRAALERRAQESQGRAELAARGHVLADRGAWAIGAEAESAYAEQAQAEAALAQGLPGLASGRYAQAGALFRALGLSALADNAEAEGKAARELYRAKEAAEVLAEAEGNPETAPADLARARAMAQETAEAAPRVLDLTPTWAEAAAVLAVVLESGTAEGRAMARRELFRMAQAADMAAAHDKAQAEALTYAQGAARRALAAFLGMGEPAPARAEQAAQDAAALAQVKAALAEAQAVNLARPAGLAEAEAQARTAAEAAEELAAARQCLIWAKSARDKGDKGAARQAAAYHADSSAAFRAAARLARTLGPDFHDMAARLDRAADMAATAAA